MGFIKNLASAISWYSGLGPCLRMFREPVELIVAYHTIDDADESYAHINISFKKFTEQVEYLKKRGYTFCRFKDVFNKSDGKRAYLYFDDGFKTIYKNIFPYLSEHDIPATLFVTVEYIESCKETYLRWDDIKQMSGVFEIGSHGMHHIKLNKISLEAAKNELISSKEAIETMISEKVFSFSYPKGRNTEKLELLASEAGYVVTTANRRFCKIRPDPQDLLSLFKWKILIR